MSASSSTPSSSTFEFPDQEYYFAAAKAYFERANTEEKREKLRRTVAICGKHEHECQGHCLAWHKALGKPEEEWVFGACQKDFWGSKEWKPVIYLDDIILKRCEYGKHESIQCFTSSGEVRTVSIQCDKRGTILLRKENGKKSFRCVEHCPRVLVEIPERKVEDDE